MVPKPREEGKAVTKGRWRRGAGGHRAPAGSRSPGLAGSHEVKIYGLAKTLADCWKFRHKIGLEVALEALSDAWRQERLDLRELDQYARICRVQRVMQPYLEAIVA